MRTAKVLKNSIRCVFLAPVYFYKYALSPMFPHTCKFQPTCSNYALKAVKDFGIFKGSLLAGKRLLKCGPWTKVHGFDPVPLNIKGELKWLL